MQTRVIPQCQEFLFYHKRHSCVLRLTSVCWPSEINAVQHTVKSNPLIVEARVDANGEFHFWYRVLK